MQSKLEVTARRRDADRVKQVESKADRVKQVELKTLCSLPLTGREAKQHQPVQHWLLVAQQLAFSSVLDRSWVAQRQLELMGGQQPAVADTKSEAALTAYSISEAALTAYSISEAALAAGGPATTEAMKIDKL